MNSLSVDYHNVTPSMLESAMLHYGWSKIKTFPNKTAVWSSSNGTAKQWVPTDSGFDDYEEVVADTIRSISEHSQTSDTDVDLYVQQFFSNKDLIQLRVFGDDIVGGNIDLQAGAKLPNALSKLIEGAFNEVSSSMKELKKSMKTAFFSECELAQTSVGSYVVNVYLPVFIGQQSDQSEQLNIECDGVNLGRKISLTLINRIVRLYRAVVDYSFDKSDEVIESLLELGFSKNDCDAAFSLFGNLSGGNSGRNWEIKALWSGIESVPKEQASLVQFDGDIAAKLRDLSKKFESVKQINNAELIGRVVYLGKDYGDQLGTFIFKSLIEDKEVKVKVTLERQLYDEAVHAHEFEQYVKLVGLLSTLDKGKKKSYSMNQVQQLQVIQPSLDVTD